MNTALTVPRVLITDDEALFRSGLVQMLDRDDRINVVGEAGDGLQAIEKIASLKPDVVLMDLRMPSLDGIEATRKIRSEYPAVKVLILTAYETDDDVVEALSVGANGYILKDAQADAIVAGILTVAAGEWVMSAPVVNRLIKMLIEAMNAKGSYGGLTRREIEVLTMLAHGMANKQIAYKLKTSEKTIRNHVSHIYSKLQITGRSQAILYAVRRGMAEP